MSKETNVRVPVVATRGIVLFPGMDSMIEVGRPKSINAVNTASASYDSMVWIVCQNDIMVDDPSQENLYQFGTLSKIKIVRRKEGFMRVTFTGMKRARLSELEDSDDIMMASIQPLDDVQGNTMEEVALVKRVISAFEKLSNVASAFPADIIAQLSKGVSAITLTDQFAQYFPLETPVKQRLLETLDVNERMVQIIAELEKQQQFSKLESSINDKVKEHIDDAIRITAALSLCALMAAFILAFRGGKLPHASDGDAFDTIYALEQTESAS